MVADDVQGPNGLAFSPDEIEALRRRVARHAVAQASRVRRDDGSTLGAQPDVHRRRAGGTPDGFRVDVDGNLWCGWGMGEPELDGVRIFNPAGKPIGHIALPERCANLCFGGR